jgi:uncharacterized 2Fe-2S/4Fe-4S cluster protein (DUF4445 family)
VGIEARRAATARVTVNGTTVDASPGTSLFECAEAVGIAVPTSCFKQGKCRECLVEVEEGGEGLTALAPQEEHLAGRFRLSCRARLTEWARDIRCHTLRRGTLRIETDAIGLAHTDLLDPAVTRRGRHVCMDGEPVAEANGPLHGLALDIGTTTVALRLFDLESGLLRATHSFENPQRFGGSDVMARIRYDGEHRGRLLQRTLAGYLGHAIESLPCEPQTIFEIVVAGNSTMRDLFFGLDVQPIGQMPYRSVTEAAWREGAAPSTAVTVKASRLRLPVHPEARVVGLPLISSHVGADAAACLLATGLAESDELAVVMDIGTNTELIAGNRHRLLAASCPAGPAFEGGGVACGMPALEGAIERVRIGEDGGMSLGVLGGDAPAGLCGSGLVDLLSELRRTERMNELGRFNDGGDRFMLDRTELFLSEADINELAQAKGANVAGLRIVLETYGCDVREIARLDLAGGFARHLDLDAARRIGFIPDLPPSRVRKVGNAALEGASIALRCASRRRWLEEVVKHVEHVRLETHPDFFDAFVEGCQFQPWGAEK